VSADLPLAGGEAVERADAARNRELLLEAAERLFAEQGPANVSMDAVAAAAGVGKGTLFRRFGDKAGLVRALLSERERPFQDALIRGAPPLGPGAPPVERLVAFGRGLLAQLERHADLVLLAETGPPGVRFGGSVYALYRTHLLVLLREAGREEDADVQADLLMAVLTAELFVFLRRQRGLGLKRVQDAWEALVRGLAGGDR
jgi:AcrR family transcriptional regulator